MSHHAEILTAPDLETLGEVFILFLWCFLYFFWLQTLMFAAVLARLLQKCLEVVCIESTHILANGVSKQILRDDAGG